MKRYHTFFFFCLIVGLIMASPVQAFNQPSVNLGATSFLDGGPPAGPGFYISQYVQYWAVDSFNDNNGNKIVFPVNPDPEMDVWISLTQLLYQSDTDLLLGGKPGVNLIVPYVGFDLDTTVFRASDPGIGDIEFGPFLQWGPIMGQSGPIFMHRIEFTMIFPTGKYDQNRTINPGSNFFSLNPYWAGTLFITPRWTISTRVHYLWNAENDEPNTESYPLGTNDVQAGQAFHMNFASAYEVVPKYFRVGVNGYWLVQTTEDKVNDVSINDTEERVFAIGPGAVIHFSQDHHLFFNAYFETSAQNRPEGNRFTLRYVGHF